MIASERLGTWMEEIQGKRANLLYRLANKPMLHILGIFIQHCIYAYWPYLAHVILSYSGDADGSKRHQCGLIIISPCQVVRCWTFVDGPKVRHIGETWS